jgi:hypothetical protein
LPAAGLTAWFDQFGRFNRAFVSLFRIAAGDTWIDQVRGGHVDHGSAANS